jgi:hypothetical protein
MTRETPRELLLRMAREHRELMVAWAARSGPEFLGIDCERSEDSLHLTAKAGGDYVGVFFRVAFLIALWALGCYAAAWLWPQPASRLVITLVIAAGAGGLLYKTMRTANRLATRTSIRVSGAKGELVERTLWRRSARAFTLARSATASVEEPDFSNQGPGWIVLESDPPQRFGKDLSDVQRAYIVRVLGDFLRARVGE